MPSAVATWSRKPLEGKIHRRAPEAANPFRCRTTISNRDRVELVRSAVLSKDEGLVPHDSGHSPLTSYDNFVLTFQQT